MRRFKQGISLDINEEVKFLRRFSLIRMEDLMLTMGCDQVCKKCERKGVWRNCVRGSL